MQAVFEREFRRVDGECEMVALVAPDKRGAYRSALFPGLWLDAAGLGAGDMAVALETLKTGPGAPEHSAFVAISG